ncbi:MAG: caspase family protein [Thermodesulfovibrionales bacterium]|nr:caspase family protein [Thermodesulfovibrionales bacterium]
MKGNLISLISVIFILLVGMAMTGCATVTQLGTAAHGGDIREVEALLNKGADVNERVMGVTPLVEAVFYNASLDIVRLLLDKGAHINIDAGSGWKPIHYAVNNGNANVVKLLLDRGADFSGMNGFGKTPLKMAEEKGLTVIARMLREAEENQYKKLYAKDEKPTPSVPEKSSVSTPKSDVDELPLVKAKPNKNSYAIVIGIESYRQKLPKADYAVNDAKTMTEYLTKVMGYPEENVVTLLNEHATKSDFEKYIEKWLPNNIEKDSSVFIYYSGHGAPNVKTGDAYLVPYDGDPSFIEQTGYSLKKLYESLNKLQAKEIIVALDSCFSGAGGKSVIAKGARPLVMNLEQDIKLSKNMIVMSASSGDQTSSTYEEKGHGLFTYFMLKGIKDGIIEIGELFDYLKPHVGRTARKVYNNEQTPQLIAPEKKIYIRNDIILHE